MLERTFLYKVGGTTSTMPPVFPLTSSKGAPRRAYSFEDFRWKTAEVTLANLNLVMVERRVS